MTKAHVEARRKQIIDAARACFLERGFHATKIQDIATRVGLSTGAPYRYFESKDDIVAATCSEALDRNRQRFGPLDLSAASSAIFEELSAVYFAAAHEPGAVDAARLTLQVWEENSRSEQAGKMLLEYFSVIQAHVGKMAIKAQEQFEIDIALDPVSVAQTMVSLVLGVIVQRAAGTDVNVEKYEEATRALVTGRLWNSFNPNEKPTTNPV